MNQTKNNSIILIGMPASGKTTISKLLADKTGLKLIDTDSLIVQKEKREITEIFKTNGEEYFRNIEHEVLISLENNGAVISTGGGIIKNIENIKILKEKGIVFYLKILPEKIFDRIKTDKTRPLLLKADPLAELKKLYDERKNNYEMADYIINADDTVENITNKVIEIYEKTIG